MKERRGSEYERKGKRREREGRGKETHLHEDDGLADGKEVVELDEDLVLVLLVVAICSEVPSLVSIIFLLNVSERIERRREENEPMKNCLIASRLSSSCFSLISFA